MSIPKIYSIINNICWQIVMWCSSLIRKRQFIWRKKKWKALTDIVNFTLNLKLEMCDEFTAKWIEAKARNIYFHWSLTLSYRLFLLMTVEIFKEFYSHSIEIILWKRHLEHWKWMVQRASGSQSTGPNKKLTCPIRPSNFFKPRVYLYFHLIHTISLKSELHTHLCYVQKILRSNCFWK